MKIKAITRSWVALLTISVAPGAIAATTTLLSVSGIYNFGDSLSDVGNTSLATGGTRPGPGYFNGRYSNGPVWVERLAARYGQPAPTTSLTGGHDSAWAGAYTAGGGSVPTLVQQAGMFVSTSSFLPTDLATVWGGANDFFFSDPFDFTSPAANIGTVITTLAGGGAKNVLLLKLPDFGDLPETLAGGAGAIAVGHNFSIGFNGLLDTMVPSLEASLGINIWLLDMFGIGKELQNDPAAFGLTNLTEGALPSGHAADASEYAYWDTVHPTAQIHTLFGDRAYELLTTPEPSSMMILWVFGVGMLTRRARARG
ncbi:MAG: SGNH/GDSL hydrolase family protein [Verrucomicrobia bacterium]|nr:SGNH/GDSL hydrolase family protein [Verrucomicrobiota bacterium]